MMLQSATPITS